MSWKINNTVIQSPDTKNVVYNTKSATNKVVSGAVNRDYVGSEKIAYQVEWNYLSSGQLAVIKAFYDSQRLSGTNMNLVIDELGININVIIDLQQISYPVKNSYDFADVQINFLQI